MAGPLKRTALKSSPEDAAFYKRFHDPTLFSLRKGTPRSEMLLELVGKGVPEKTAERIVLAVEQELAIAAAAHKPRTSGWKMLGFVALVWGAIAGYLVWQMTRDSTFSWGYLIAGGVIALILTARVIGRIGLGLREPVDLPPPK
jgi:hypothetical protein